MSVSFNKNGVISASRDQLGDNLLLDSGIIIDTTSYNMHNYYYSTPPTMGETYTIQIKGTLGEGKTAWGLYNSGGTGGASSPTVIGTTGKSNYLTTNFYDEKSGIWTAQLIWSYGENGNNFLRIYQMPSAITDVVSHIDWIKLEAGSVATPWTLPINDVKQIGYEVI